MSRSKKSGRKRIRKWILIWILCNAVFIAVFLFLQFSKNQDTLESERSQMRMIQALNSDPDAAPNAQVGRVYEAIHAFVKEAPQFDDITMLCIQYKGSDACEENRIQMQKTAALSAVRSGLSDRAGCHGEL